MKNKDPLPEIAKTLDKIKTEMDNMAEVQKNMIDNLGKLFRAVDRVGLAEEHLTNRQVITLLINSLGGRPID